MQTESLFCVGGPSLDECLSRATLPGADLVIAFGSTAVFHEGGVFEKLRRQFGKALVLGCSTAGEIHGTRVSDDSLSVVAVKFREARVRGAKVRLASMKDSHEAGASLATTLSAPDLVHVLVLSDGLAVNGTKLVAGLSSKLPKSVAATGGLSGDGSRFERTLVMLDGPPEQGVVAAVGFYGRGLHVGYGSLGGWDAFGPERMITRSTDNTLFELDERPALDLYKTYLGDQAAGLPATGLLFPISLTLPGGTIPVVRTVLSVNEKDKSMTFAGDMPQGAMARLMKANFDRLIEGASGAAEASQKAGVGKEANLAILISCVGRKLVLKQRIEEEVESVRQVLGEKPALVGFYSYGEISPFSPNARCELHNQTMTITTLTEE
jgi:hypothetical protein